MALDHVGLIASNKMMLPAWKYCRIIGGSDLMSRHLAGVEPVFSR